MLPRTSSGHVAQDIWPCCPGHLLAMLPRTPGHVAQDPRHLSRPTPGSSSSQAPLPPRAAPAMAHAADGDPGDEEEFNDHYWLRKGYTLKQIADYRTEQRLENDQKIAVTNHLRHDVGRVGRDMVEAEERAAHEEEMKRLRAAGQETEARRREQFREEQRLHAVDSRQLQSWRSREDRHEGSDNDRIAAAAQDMMMTAQAEMTRRGLEIQRRAEVEERRALEEENAQLRAETERLRVEAAAKAQADLEDRIRRTDERSRETWELPWQDWHKEYKQRRFVEQAFEEAEEASRRELAETDRPATLPARDAPYHTSAAPTAPWRQPPVQDQAGADERRSNPAPWKPDLRRTAPLPSSFPGSAAYEAESKRLKDYHDQEDD